MCIRANLSQARNRDLCEQDHYQASTRLGNQRFENRLNVRPRVELGPRFAEV